jgi:CelD/BcsL family acetyltransferase involved in cellulose biosynthesis
LTVLVVKNRSALAQHVSAWDDLATAALEPNPFYESWLFLPAVQAFGAGQDLQFVLVFARGDSQRPLLCGFFPLQRRRHYRGLPVNVVSLWRHKHCFLCTPLLRAGYAPQTLTALFDWLVTAARGAALVEFAHVTGDGPFQQILAEHCAALARPRHVAEQTTRAFFRPRASAEVYLREVLSGTHRRALKRRHKRLAEAGHLQSIHLTAGADVDAWMETFQRLEVGGWKGSKGTALACSPADRAFFTAAARAAFRRGRLLMTALHLDGRPIACRCSFIAGAGSFAFKSAFDEQYAPFSPGVLLELENLRYLHSAADIAWMDSCAEPENAMINRLWKERRTMQTVVVATGRKPGDLVVALLPWLRWLKRTLFGRGRVRSAEPPGAVFEETC